MIKEREMKAFSGGPAFLVIFAILILIEGAVIWAAVSLAQLPRGESRAPLVTVLIVGTLASLADLICLAGLFTVNPNEAKIVQFFGRYVGTVRESGWHWISPFYQRRSMSLRVRNFESNKLKV